jgi:alkaline phosphatase D
MSTGTRVVLTLVVTGVIAAVGNSLAVVQPSPLVLTHGIASGDVTASSAVIWGRASGKSQMHVEVAADPSFRAVKSSRSAAASEATDFTAQLTVRGLDPDTR